MAHAAVTNIFNALRSRKKTIPPLPDGIWQHPLYFLAFGLGTGTLPFAPGTFGTLMAIPLYLLVQSLSLPFYLLFVFVFIVFSCWISERISHDIQIHDHPGMNIDEFAGFFVTMIDAPQGFGWILLGFLLFRLFDIWKPWPIRFIDIKIHNGIGIVLDDIVGGIYACLLIQIIARIVQ